MKKIPFQLVWSRKPFEEGSFHLTHVISHTTEKLITSHTDKLSNAEIKLVWQHQLSDYLYLFQAAETFCPLGWSLFCEVTLQLPSTEPGTQYHFWHTGLVRYPFKPGCFNDCLLPTGSCLGINIKGQCYLPPFFFIINQGCVGHLNDWVQFCLWWYEGQTKLFSH